MSSDALPSLTVADYVVAVIIVSVPVGIGILYAVKDMNKTTRAEYLLGGRQMSVLPVALSMFVTFQSAITMIGVPAETFYYGGIYYLAWVGQMLCYIVGYFTIVQLAYPLQVTSVYEYLQLRYKSKAVRMISTVIGMLAYVCYLSVALLSPALALEASAGIPLWMSIAVLGAVGTLYTAIGGIKSVIWTDVFQTVIIFAGMFIVIIKGCISVGGLGEVWRISQTAGRLDFAKFSIDPRSRHTVWSLSFGIASMWLINSFNQSMVQRVCCMKTFREAKISYLLNIPLVFIYMTFLTLVGMVIFAYFWVKQCEPFEAGLITNRNQLAPYFVLHAMENLPGMAGLYTSILCCGSLSTLSSGVNALAANTVEDLLQRPLRTLREATITFITKLMVVFYGAVIIGLTYLATTLDGPVTQIASSALGSLGSPIIGIFMMGGSIPWANKYGALSGIAVSLVFNLWISIGSRLQGLSLNALQSPGTEGCSQGSNRSTIVSMIKSINSTSDSYPIHYAVLSDSPTTQSIVSTPGQDNIQSSDTFFLYDVTYEWYSLMGTFVCVIVGLSVSYITNNWCKSFQKIGDRKSSTLKFSDFSSHAESRYTFPFIRRFWGMDDPQVECYSLSNVEGVNIRKVSSASTEQT